MRTESTDELLRHWLAEAKTRGLIGPEPLDRTIAHARALGRVATSAWQGEGDVVDLGSGGGVPGLVLALDWAGSRWTLLDSNLRSAAFLEEAVSGLGLRDRVAIVASRAEEVGRSPAHRERYALCTARAVAPAPVVAEYISALLGRGGVAVISEPPASAERWDSAGLALLGLELETLESDPAAAVLRRTGPLSDRYPRRTGVARKRPLW